MKTRVQTVTCPECKSEIYSRAVHDYHACQCGKTTVDGGFDYLRFGWEGNTKPKTGIRYVSASRSALYDDWNHREKKYGFILPKK